MNSGARLLRDLLILLLAIGILLLIGKGLGAVSPAAGGVLRALAHPLTLLALLALLLLWRWRRPEP